MPDPDQPQGSPLGRAGGPARGAGLEEVGVAVSVQGLTRRFGQDQAVEDLNFRIEEGELFGIVGPDGAGKTTTLRMLAGVLPPTGGKGVIHGVDVALDPEGVKPFIAYMAQQFGLYQDLTVAENIRFYADLYRVPQEERPARLERLYRFSNLGPFKDRLAGNLSGGMKQKLALCCALIHQPTVLLLDEPTFGVDPISRRDLWLILHQMVEEGITVVVSTSYLDEAERCDRVALLHGGTVLALGSPEELLNRLPGQVVAVEDRDPRRIRDLLRGMDGVAGTALFGNVVHAVLDGGTHVLDDVSRVATEAGVAPAGIQVVEPSLEDVFLHLVREREEGLHA